MQASGGLTAARESNRVSPSSPRPWALPTLWHHWTLAHHANLCLYLQTHQTSASQRLIMFPGPQFEEGGGVQHGEEGEG